MERKAKSSTFFTQVDIKFPISLCHQKMKKPSNIFHKIRLFLLSTVAEEKNYSFLYSRAGQTIHMSLLSHVKSSIQI